MDRWQREAPDGNVYYSEDFKLHKEVPKHRLKHREADLESSEREIVIQPNNIEFFYAEEETSERAYRLESQLEKLYRILLWAALCAGSVVLFLHLRQRHQMH